MRSRVRLTTILLLPALTVAIAVTTGARVAGRSSISDRVTIASDAAREGAAPENAPTVPRTAFAEPGISPDGKEIAFVSGGDIWTVPATGGEARLLVSHPAAESRPLYSPDGRMLAFVSTRTGNGDIYVLTLDTGDLRRVTYDDAAEM